uniref:Uncharacterized protein n=1 Tax=Quercus lobata TaxID=97700 RepID=A0A7N2MCJ0_QUELO
MKLGVSLKSGVHEDGSRTESVKVNHKAQVTAHGLAAVLNTVNPRDAMSEQLMDEAVNLDAPEVMHTVGKRTKGVINVSLSTPQFSGNHNIKNQGAVFSAKEFDDRINEIDSEMGKFDHINCMTQPTNISQDILSEAREKHVLAKPQSQRQVFNIVNIPDKEKSATTTMKGNEPDKSNQPLHRAIWKPPPWLILKVNSDDAIFWEQNSVDVVLDMGGGLVLFWRSTIDVIVEGSGTNYIDTMFQEEDRAWIGVII